LKEEFKNRMIKLPSCTVYYILSLHKIMDTLGERDRIYISEKEVLKVFEEIFDV